MTIQLPGYEFGFAACRVIHTMADTPLDEDRLPEAYPGVGAVVFRPRAKQRRVGSTFVVHETFRFDLDDEGYMVDNNDARTVGLIVGDYDVSFDLKNGKIEERLVTITALHTEENPCQLATHSGDPEHPAGAVFQTILLPGGMVEGGYLKVEDGVIKWVDFVPDLSGYAASALDSAASSMTSMNQAIAAKNATISAIASSDTVGRRRTNYVVNPSFENDVLEWRHYSSGGTSIARDTSWATSGSACLRLTITNSAKDAGVWVPINTGGVVPDREFVVSAYVLVGIGAPHYPTLESTYYAAMYYPNIAGDSGPCIGEFVENSDDGYPVYRFDVLVPVASEAPTRVYIPIFNDYGQWPGGTGFLIDSVYSWYPEDPVDYFDGDSVIPGKVHGWNPNGTSFQVDPSKPAELTPSKIRTTIGNGRPDVMATMGRLEKLLTITAKNGARFISLDRPQGAVEWECVSGVWKCIRGKTPRRYISSTLQGVDDWGGRETVVYRENDTVFVSSRLTIGPTFELAGTPRKRMLILFKIPQGYMWFDNYVTLGIGGVTDIDYGDHIASVYGSDSRDFSFQGAPGTWAVGNDINFSASWGTLENWPTTLPGSPV